MEVDVRVELMAAAIARIMAETARTERAITNVRTTQAVTTRAARMAGVGRNNAIPTFLKLQRFRPYLSILWI